MFHAPLFQEGQVSHGSKLVIAYLPSLKIVQTIQPTDDKNIVDFSLNNDGRGLTVVASWSKEWRSFQIPEALGSNQRSVRASAGTLRLRATSFHRCATER
jgi:hypothetical protein